MTPEQATIIAYHANEHTTEELRKARAVLIDHGETRYMRGFEAVQTIRRELERRGNRTVWSV